jgi:hypothetical protein
LLGELLIEVQKQYVNQKERCEGLIRDKSEIVGSLDSLRNQYQVEMEKLEFDKNECIVTIETLRTENDVLKSEINELSGDDKKGLSRMDENSPMHLTNEVPLSIAGVTSPKQTVSNLVSSNQADEFQSQLNALFSKLNLPTDCIPSIAELAVNYVELHSKTTPRVVAVGDAVQLQKKLIDIMAQRDKLEKDLENEVLRVFSKLSIIFLSR